MYKNNLVIFSSCSRRKYQLESRALSRKNLTILLSMHGIVKIVQKYKSIKVQKFNGKLSPVISNTLAVAI